MLTRLTKTQKEIEELAKRVPRLTAKQTEWAVKMFRYDVRVSEYSGKATCPDCHGKISVNNGRLPSRCPHCGAKVNATTNAYRRDFNHHEDFFQVMNVVGGWQVTRLIYMQRYCYVRKDNHPWEFYEVCQAWNHPDYETTYFRSLPKAGLYCHYRFNPYSLYTWSYEENADEETFHHYRAEENRLEPRIPGGRNYFDTRNICPDAKILPYFKQRGITANALRSIREYTAMGLMESFVRGGLTPMLETLLKCGGYKVFNKVTDPYERALHKEMENAYWTAWKICQRNGYKHCNSVEWIDMVPMLQELGLDYHSPHYVCPDNLHDMHQRLLRMKKRREDKKELEKRMKENAKYVERVGKYLDLEFKSNGLRIIVLQSIKAFKDEADHLGHCVYSGRYYNKENSLILSARGKRNKRWETIEVDLRTFKILQCYGYGDKHTSRHNEIIDIVNANMWQIKERKMGIKRKRGRKAA